MFQYLSLGATLIFVISFGACNSQIAPQSVNLDRYAQTVSQSQSYVTAAGKKNRVGQINPNQYTAQQSTDLLNFYYATDFQTLRYTLLGQKVFYELAYGIPGEKLHKIDHNVRTLILTNGALRRAIVGNSLVLGIPITIPPSISADILGSIQQKVALSLIKNRGQTEADYTEEELSDIDDMALGIAASLIYQVDGQLYTIKVRLATDGNALLSLVPLQQFTGLKPMANNDADLELAKKAFKRRQKAVAAMGDRLGAGNETAKSIEEQQDVLFNTGYLSLYAGRLNWLEKELWKSP